MSIANYTNRVPRYSVGTLLQLVSKDVSIDGPTNQSINQSIRVFTHSFKESIEAALCDTKCFTIFFIDQVLLNDLDKSSFNNWYNDIYCIFIPYQF
jgi:hypothetical protein